MMSGETMNRVFLCVGSNIEPETNLPAAVRLLQQFGRVVAVSQVWETPPVDGSDQPNYLNGAILFETPLSADRLKFDAIASVEAQLHRVRDAEDTHAARTIDIDIVLFNREVLRIEHRRVPDPDILTRPFVAVPLAELDADYVHPETHESLQTIAAACAVQTTPMTPRPDVRLNCESSKSGGASENLSNPPC